MYTVYVDDHIIYSPLLVDSGFIIFSGTANIKLNEPGSFEFVIPKNNPYYDLITPRKSIIKLYDGEDMIFKGIASEFGTDFNNMKSTFCKGVLAFFDDTLCRPFEFRGTISQYLLERIKQHNGQVDDYKKFRLGRVTVIDPNNYIYRYKETFDSTMTVLTEQLLNSYGGYFVVREENGENILDYLADFPDNTVQNIEFGKNLLDFVSTSTTDDLYTAMIPRGADIETDESNSSEGYHVAQKVDITSVNGGKDWIVDQAAANLYGIIWRYQEYSDITEPANLLAKARADLAANVDINLTLEVPAFDLSLVNADADRLGVGKYTRIISKPHNFDRVLLCNEVEINLDDPQSNKYIFGATLKKSTDYIAGVRQATVTAEKANTTAQNTSAEIQNIKENVVTKGSIFPVGSIYMSVDSTNPSVYFGGTWVSWGSGRVPVGVSSDIEFNDVEKTGGEKTHALTNSEIPGNVWRSSAAPGDNINVFFNNGATYGINTNSVKPVGTAHNILQPYITCYMWKRTD